MKHFLSVAILLSAPMAFGSTGASVQVTPPNVHGSRTVEPSTERAVVQDYLQSWKSLQSALSHNDAQVLSRDFVGTALTTLTQTVQNQQSLGLSTVDSHPSHHIQIIFYSPNGLSIQLMDTLSYREEVLQHGRSIGSKEMHAHFLAVLTPGATRWMVRVLQAESGQ
jgi:hypothetical protein